MRNQREINRWWIAVVVVLLAGASSSSASIVAFNWTTGFANDGFVPDNSYTGWQDTRTISTFESGLEISDVNVTLNLSGGFNGDLYGTLTHSDGFVVLLNCIGVTSGNPAGYLNPGMNVTFDDSAATDIHLHGTVTGILTGTWQPDGRTADPSVVTDASSRVTSLASFNGLDPNGSWTLALQDVSFGGQSQVTGWGLQITAVPEPVTVALGIFGVLLGGTAAGRMLRKQFQPRAISHRDGPSSLNSNGGNL